MSSIFNYKIETHEIAFTPSTGDTKTIVFSNIYSALPKVTATSSIENVNVYVSDISTTEVTISTSCDLTVDIITHVHVIGI